MSESVFISLGILEGANRDGTALYVTPVGDYAVDKDGNIFYNFKIDDEIYIGGSVTSAVVLKQLETDIGAVTSNSEFKLKTKTLLYPISLI